MRQRVRSTDGMLYALIRQVRPDLAGRVASTDRLETAVIGLGSQGVKHAGLMREYGTEVVAGVAPGRGGTRIHEVIPVYDTVADCLAEHPDIVAASVWRHYSTARDATLEAIEAGIPLIVLITEGVPMRDLRDMLVAARKARTLLVGGNTPGLIFPPERIKIGMLPDVFAPEEPKPGQYGSRGVTILSRSGAILYHLSDALASVGISQNAVIGVGGDGATGSTFRQLVPLAMGHEKTDAVVIAGEIGGCQEELLARDMMAHPERYPKPLVALISGAHAPEGKTMGHAGAIVTPGLEMGTFQAKREALEAAGVTVVNSQYDLIKAVQKTVGGKTYFDPARYYDRLRRVWEAPPPRPSWGTVITRVEPNSLSVQGYRLEDLIEHSTLLEVLHLLLQGELPDRATGEAMTATALAAAQGPPPSISRNPAEEVSKTLAKYILGDEELAGFNPEGRKGRIEKTAFFLGRLAAYLADLLDRRSPVAPGEAKLSLAHLLHRILTGEDRIDPSRARLLEAMAVASIDHGVTPPSAQATIIAASVRTSFEVALAQGIGAITDVHGGAGEKAAAFFTACARRSRQEGISLARATRLAMAELVKSGRRVEGMGHRIHTEDPRRDILWRLADGAGVSGSCVAISRMAADALHSVRGLRLPINVDGVIGAVVADLGLEPWLAKALFIYGRAAGLAAHYFEEITTQAPMRSINFSQAVYRGPEARLHPAVDRKKQQPG